MEFEYLKIRDLRKNLKTILDGEQPRPIGDRWRLRGIVVPVIVRQYAHSDEREKALRQAEKKIKELFTELRRQG